MKANKKIRISVIFILTLAICFGVYLGLNIHESKRHNTILKSAIHMNIRMPSGKIVSTNEWFTRDSSADLGLLVLIKDSTGPYHLIENLNRENQAMMIEDGEESEFLVVSATSHSFFRR